MPNTFAQLPLTNNSSANQPPIGVNRDGFIESTAVRFEGEVLITIASPTVNNRDEPGNQVPVEERARQIEANLNQLLVTGTNPNIEEPATYSTLLNPDSLEVYIQTINNQPVLFATDGIISEPEAILTVTRSDAQYHATPIDDLAELWRTDIEAKLRQALEERQPGALKKRISSATKLLLAAIAVTILLLIISRLIRRRYHQLEKLKQLREIASNSDLTDSEFTDSNLTESELTGTEEPADPSIQAPVQTIGAPTLNNETNRLAIIEQLRQIFNFQRRLRILKFVRWLLFWGIILVWAVTSATILYRFPVTRRFSISLFSSPFVILVTWFITGLVNRLINLAIDRFVDAWQENSWDTNELIARRAVRISTIVNTIKGLKTAVIYGISLVWVLQTLNIAAASILVASGAVFALAMSFAAQNVVKDLVNGFLILLEDQYAIGDIIAVNAVSGKVENLNLRITQIRSEEGNLITIPNSQISQIENKTRLWSRGTYRVQVAYDTDVDQVINVIRQVAEDIAKDPVWGFAILNPAEVLGVEDVSHAGIVILIWIRTLPSKQWEVLREYRRRLKIAFDYHNIRIGVPQQSLTGDFISQVTNN